jgi:hypothetical protein
VPTLERTKAAKRSAVSTGQLRPLLALHARPFDLVVFQEPMLQVLLPARDEYL